MSEISLRKAGPEDASLILEFIRELAKYERAASEVTATVADIERNLFHPETTTEAIICSIDRKPIGYAVYFLSFSTWLGKNGLFLEDLYISPNSRGAGAGKKILKHLANVAISNGCGRLEWNVLDWNEPAIRFYESIGAKARNEWVGYRLEGEPLVEVARS